MSATDFPHDVRGRAMRTAAVQMAAYYRKPLPLIGVMASGHPGVRRLFLFWSIALLVRPADPRFTNN